MAIDRTKLERLMLDGEQIHAERRSVATLYEDTRQDRAQAIARLGAGLSREAQRHWRAGDEVAQLLALPAEVKETIRAEVAAAQYIQALTVRMQALQARLGPLTAQANDMNKLLRRCEEYARDHH